MARSRSDGRRFPAVRPQRAIVIAVLVMLLPLASCATMFTGTTQLVPVTSQPERGEVFVDGVSMGFTPLELTLRRNADVTVDVRLGDRTRSFVLRSETQGAMVGLDMVPVGLMGGIIVIFGALASGPYDDSPSAQFYVASAGLLGASLVPIAVDYGTGALFRLRPVEIVAVFD